MSASCSKSEDSPHFQAVLRSNRCSPKHMSPSEGKMAKGAPKGRTHQNVDHIASRLLLQSSKDPDVCSVAGTALSDTRTSP